MQTNHTQRAPRTSKKRNPPTNVVKVEGFLVPRDRIELPTRGFSVPISSYDIAREFGIAATTRTHLGQKQ